MHMFTGFAPRIGPQTLWLQGVLRNLLFCSSFLCLPNIFAKCEKAFGKRDLAGLPSFHPHCYPQILWTKDFYDFCRGLPLTTPQAKVRRLIRPRRASVFSIILAAGWPIWPLLFASVISVALIIERLVALRRSKVLPAGLLQSVITEYRKQSLTESTVASMEAQSPLGRVLAAGLRNVGSSREIMREAIEETGAVVAHELERYLTTLGTIASISPLMGLFGTVVGMIEIFSSQAPSGSNPVQLAHGISVALYNTGFGLLIAIPSMIFWRHFRALVNSFVVDMQQQAVRLVEVLHGDRRA